MKNICLGLSLSNLLISLAIISILLTATTPSLTGIINKQHASAIMDKLGTLIYFTRQQAITSNTYTTLCPSKNLISCVNDWGEQLILFTDHNKNEVVDGRDTVLRVSTLTSEHSGYLTLNTAGKKYLQFNSRGHSNGKWGNLTYCPSNHDLTLARRLIINRTGRVRYEKDSNGDGIIDTSTPLMCD